MLLNHFVCNNLLLGLVCLFCDSEPSPQKRFLERQSVFFKVNPDVNPSTYPRKNLVLLLMKVEEDIVRELDSKTPTDQLKIYMQDGPEQFNEIKAGLIEQGFIFVPKKTGRRINP